MKKLLLFAVVLGAAIPATIARADAVLHSATGSGQTVFVTENRTFAFTARQYADATAKGEAEVVNRDFGLVTHIQIDCYQVLGPNAARMSGTITRSNNTAIVGDGGVFAVQDNGEGANSPPDLISFVAFGPPAPNLNCHTIQIMPTVPVERGNVQVHN